MLENADLLDDDYDSGSRRSWGTSISVDGTTYATSLFWQPLQNLNDPFQEVEEASGEVLEGADLFCIKGGKAPQFGICVSQEGYKSGEFAAAVALSTAMSNFASYVGVFKTDRGWWYICVRNDIILSDGDMLFLDENEAKSQFMSMLAVPDWDKKFAPEEWKIADTETVDVEEIILRGAKAKLQKIKGLRGAKLLAVVGVSAVVGIWLFSSIINHIFLTPQVRPVVVPVKPKVVKQIEQPPEIKPWEKVTNPVMTAHECYKGIISLVQILPPGWKISPLTCTSGSIATSWTREMGRLSWMKKALDTSGYTFSGVSFTSDGNNVTVALPLPVVEQQASPPNMTLVNLQNDINDTFQAIGYPISLGTSSYTSNRGTIYNMITFTMDSTHDPLIWVKLLTKYSGLEFKTIGYNPDSKTWHYEGIIYVL